MARKLQQYAIIDKGRGREIELLGKPDASDSWGPGVVLFDSRPDMQMQLCPEEAVALRDGLTRFLEDVKAASTEDEP